MPFAINEINKKTGIPISELQEMAEIFQLVDTDQGGTISRHELEQLMKTLGIQITSNEMDLMMNEVDAKGTSEIDFESFVLQVTKKVQTTITRNQLKSAFRVLETYGNSHDGTVFMKILIEAFTEYSSTKLVKEDAIELIKEVAPQGQTGILDYLQFLSLYFPDE